MSALTQDELRQSNINLPVLHVDRFGARDGAGDDTAALQATFDRAAALGGGCVRFHPGATYNIGSSPVKVLSSSVPIVVEGGGAILRSGGSGAQALMRIHRNGGTLISNLQFVGFGKPSGEIGLQMTNCKRMRVQDCSFEALDVGIQLVNDGDESEPWSEHNDFYADRIVTCGTGVHMTVTNGGNASIAGNLFHHLNIANTDTHLHVGAAASFYRGRVEDSIFFFPNGGTGVLVDGGVSGTVFDINMEETGSGTPTAYEFASGASGTNTCYIRSMLTGTGFVSPPIQDATSNGAPAQQFTGSGADHSALINGAGSSLGFHGTTPVAQQVLATGSSTDDVIVALQNLGLVAQS